MEPTAEEYELATQSMEAAMTEVDPASLTTTTQWRHAMRTDPVYAHTTLWDVNVDFRTWMTQQLYA